ncbi:MAG: hypothetical protein ABIS86_19680 [Streptosporangiaceae bacterium]
MTVLPGPESAPRAPDPRSRAGILMAALTRRAQEQFSGTLVLAGDPGGRVRMQAGLLVTAGTPAAPGPEPLLLRSGRINETAWSEAFAAAAPDGRLAAELVDRGLLGAAGVEVIAQTSLVDAVFAMALSGVHTCTAEPAGADQPPPLLPAVPGMDTDRVIRETLRRLALAATWQELGLTVHSRPRATRPDPARQDLLDRANGRRTARDIAFAVGRGLYPVLTDLAALIEDGLVTLSPPTVTLHSRPDPGSDPELPRRRRGESSVNTVLPWRPDR